jgi:hypothetical protein
MGQNAWELKYNEWNDILIEKKKDSERVKVGKELEKSWKRVGKNWKSHKLNHLVCDRIFHLSKNENKIFILNGNKIQLLRQFHWIP